MWTTSKIFEEVLYQEQGEKVNEEFRQKMLKREYKIPKPTVDWKELVSDYEKLFNIIGNYYECGGYYEVYQTLDESLKKILLKERTTGKWSIEQALYSVKGIDIKIRYVEAKPYTVEVVSRDTGEKWEYLINQNEIIFTCEDIDITENYDCETGECVSYIIINTSVSPSTRYTLTIGRNIEEISEVFLPNGSCMIKRHDTESSFYERNNERIVKRDSSGLIELRLTGMRQSADFCAEIRKDGKLHNEYGPVYICLQNSKLGICWYRNGERHNENGPGVVRLVSGRIEALLVYVHGVETYRVELENGKLLGCEIIDRKKHGFAHEFIFPKARFSNEFDFTYFNYNKYRMHGASGRYVKGNFHLFT